jgi:hypothetical protein
MEQEMKQSLWKQFGAAIDMLENAIVYCPADHWDTERKFWYNAYHCLFYLDYYLTLQPQSFSPPAPFGFSEFDPAGAMPERTYTKQELLGYLKASREKCHSLIGALTPELAANRWKNEYRDFSVFEILLYNLRHVQHHAAQLNLLLRQSIDDVPRWVSQTKADL